MTPGQFAALLGFLSRSRASAAAGSRAAGGRAWGRAARQRGL